MQLRTLIQGAVIGALALTACLGAGTAARAQGYTTVQYYAPPPPPVHPEMRARRELRNRVEDLSDRVRLADRERQISHREALKFQDRIEYVRDLVLHDHFIDPDEYHRWNRRLDDVEHDFHDARRR